MNQSFATHKNACYKSSTKTDRPRLPEQCPGHASCLDNHRLEHKTSRVGSFSSSCNKHDPDIYSDNKVPDWAMDDAYSRLLIIQQVALAPSLTAQMFTKQPIPCQSNQNLIDPATLHVQTPLTAMSPGPSLSFLLQFSPINFGQLNTSTSFTNKILAIQEPSL